MERIAKDELMHRVDEVLFYVWDPIGVKDAPEARAEYRSYVPQLLELLHSDRSEDEIAGVLDQITTQQMGLGQNHKHSLEIAALLKHHRKAISDATIET